MSMQGVARSAGSLVIPLLCWLSFGCFSMREVTAGNPLNAILQAAVNAEYWSQTWKGMARGWAVFAALGIVVPAVSGGAVVIDEVAGFALTGALEAFLTRNLRGYIADPRVMYILSPQQK